MGGVAIDPSAQVLMKQDGKHIPGIFAAGEVSNTQLE